MVHRNEGVEMADLFDKLKALVTLHNAGEIEGASREFAEGAALLREIDPQVDLGDEDEADEHQRERESKVKSEALDEDEELEFDEDDPKELRF